MKLFTQNESASREGLATARLIPRANEMKPEQWTKKHLKLSIASKPSG
jgi:hypothetical protein